MKNNTYSLPKILMTAYDTEEEIIESLESVILDVSWSITS